MLNHNQIKKFSVASYIFFLSALFPCVDAKAQNVISNGDFEIYSALPVGQAQIANAVGWDDVVQTSDYMNITYQGWCPHVGGSYSGNGYAGFGTYGDLAGSSEAVGQNISASHILPGINYFIRLYSKKASEGGNSTICGGIQLYGFTFPPPIHILFNHVSNLPGAKLLWTSDMIADSTWKNYNGCFQADTIINYIALTLEKAPGCNEYIYLDSVSITTNAQMLDDDASLCIGKTLILNVTVDDGDYTWQDGSSNSAFTATEPGIYWVQVTLNTCTIIDSIIVGPGKCNPILKMPNVFTPNNDFVNDLFIPIEIDAIIDPRIFIYTRWGQKIFESADLLTGWDGKFDNKICADGTYYWVVDYSDTEGIRNTIKGFLMLQQ